MSGAPIPIGITARNEARNIRPLLASVRASAAYAASLLGLRYELHVLLNDNEDETPVLLAGEPDLTLWHTRGGLVEAQRALAAARPQTPFLIFTDADILLALPVIAELSAALLKDPAVEIAYAEKTPIEPLRPTPLARALYLYNLHEGYQTHRHYCNGQCFAIRHWSIPQPAELRWDPAADNPFLHLAAGIRTDDIYLSRIALRDAGPAALRCTPAPIYYRPPATLRGMFRKYQRMCLEIERLNHYFPETRPTHRRWGRRRLDRSRLARAPRREQAYYGLFQAALLLCRVAYHLQRGYYMHLSRRPCPTWLPVVETKDSLAE